MIKKVTPIGTAKQLADCVACRCKEQSITIYRLSKESKVTRQTVERFFSPDKNVRGAVNLRTALAIVAASGLEVCSRTASLEKVGKL